MIQISSFRNRSALRLILLTGLVGIFGMLSLPVRGSASSQGFSLLRGQPQSGMLVSLTANPGVIEPANSQNSKSLVGVIVLGETNLDQQQGQVNVKTDGAASALVSTLAGDVSVGDRIAPSALEGVGAKINTNGWVLGVAQGSLDAKTKGAVKTTVTDAKGAKRDVYVASIPVAVKVTYFNSSTAGSGSQSTGIPESIQKIADTIVGKHVSTIAIVLSFLLALFGLIVAGFVVNGAIRGGILGLSRQPLAKGVILRAVWRALLAAVLILGFAFAISVVILKLL